MTTISTERNQIENLIDQLCNLDEQYEIRIRDGSMTPAMKNYILSRIDEVESALWNLDLNRSDLEWFTTHVRSHAAGALTALYME